MSARDPVAVLLGELNRPVRPRPEFAEALLTRLLGELAARDGRAGRWEPSRSRLSLWPLRRRSLLVGAVALAIAAAAATAVVVSRPAPASALDVLQQARRAFAKARPFAAMVRLELNPDGSLRTVPNGATATVLISYDARGRFRSEIVSEQPRLRNGPSPGSYEVFDGRRIVSYDARGKVLFSALAPSGFRPLEFLRWQGAHPNWDQVCRGRASKVLPDTRVAARAARHIRCIDFIGETWELWIDRQTGLALRTLGRIGGDDLFFGLGLSTSAKGGFAVEQVRYNPSFPAGTFTIGAPHGPLDYQARRQAAIAKVPPFHAVYSARYGRTGAASYVAEAWWQNDRTWRRQILVDRSTDPNRTGAGSFTVYAHGRLDSYDATDNSYSKTTSTAFNPLNPVDQLLPVADSSYSTRNCPIVGHAHIAGRDAVHRRCTPPLCPASRCRYDLWLDRATGLTLRTRTRTFELRVRTITYEPTFPRAVFRFVAPAGSRNAQQLANDPYYKTELRPGRPAPDWHAALLGGGSFHIADLRGRPALLLLQPDWCSDPACNVLERLEHTHRRHEHVAVVWVDFQGTPAQAPTVVRHNHLTFPVVVDHSSTSTKTWAIQAYPYWLLLDRHGNVVEARLKPQTSNQLENLLAKAK